MSAAKKKQLTMAIASFTWEGTKNLKSRFEMTFYGKRLASLRHDNLWSHKGQTAHLLACKIQLSTKCSVYNGCFYFLH